MSASQLSLSTEGDREENGSSPRAVANTLPSVTLGQRVRLFMHVGVEKRVT